METTMKTIEALNQAQADSAEVCRLLTEGKRVTDPELRRRISERAQKVRQEIFGKHGIVDWAVDMARDARDQ